MGVAAKELDAVYYPETDDMGEHEIRRFIAEMLRPLIVRWLRAQSRVAHAGADQFFYFDKGTPKRCRAPDLYVVDGLAQDIPEVGAWKTWEGHFPAFALEVVGTDWKKDYLDARDDYDAMGARELVIFDPWANERSRKRVRWQVYRRVRAKGLALVENSSGDRVHVKSLDAWLRRVDDEGHVRLRLGTGARGDELVPTDREIAATERAAREASDAEVARLRAEIERLRRGR